MHKHPHLRTAVFTFSFPGFHNASEIIDESVHPCLSVENRSGESRDLDLQKTDLENGYRCSNEHFLVPGGFAKNVKLPLLP